MKTTSYQVRVLFAQSGRLGIFSFISQDEASMVYHFLNTMWHHYAKATFVTVNGLVTVDTDEFALVMLVC